MNLSGYLPALNFRGCLYPLCVREQSTREQCREGQSWVTETVGPSVVKTQKSSDKFCDIEWSKRKKEKRPTNRVLFPPTLNSLEPPTYQGETMCNVDHQPGVNLINPVNLVDQTVLEPNSVFVEELDVFLLLLGHVCSPLYRTDWVIIVGLL